ncbi:hypothetical protein Tco_1531969 [Tanacetum coccineum]
MAGEDDQNINNQPPNPPPLTQQAPHTVLTIKLPILKKGEYDIWAMKMEHYLAHTDYPVWEVIQNGNGPVSISTDTQEDHLARFHNISNVKEMWDAIKTRFGGNAKNTGGQAEEEEEDHPLMAFNSNISSNEVQSCSDECVTSYNKLKQFQLWYEEKIRFMKIDLDDKTDVLTYHKKLLAEAEKEKEDLKAKVEKWHNSSKNLNILLNSQMSARDKAGLGYGNQMNKGVLSYENEVFQSVFVSRTSETENSPVNDRYAEGMHVVPPPMTGIYIPSGPDTEIDDSQFTYGPKQSKPSESDARSSDFTSCESNTSEETHESMSETVVNEPTVVSQPKVWNDTPIIEEYELESEDEHVSLPSKEQETPSFANTIKHIKTPRQTVKQQNTCSKSPKPDKKDCSGLISKKLGLGYGFTTKACFVCGSLSHLIRYCDFHEKRMAKQVELNKQKAVLTRTGKILVNTTRASGTNNVSTARHNLNRQAVPTNATMKVNTVKPIVNNARPKGDFHKSISPFRKSLIRTTPLRTNFSYQKVNIAEVKAVSAIGGKRETAVKPSAGCNWRTKSDELNLLGNEKSSSRRSTRTFSPHPRLLQSPVELWEPEFP